MQEIVTDGTNELKIDTAVKTDVRISNNRPDIQVYDRRNKRIYIVEVGITCPERICETENHKYRKYDSLAKELEGMYKMPDTLVPIVYSWDCLITKLHTKHLDKLDIPINDQEEDLPDEEMQLWEILRITYDNRIMVVKKINKSVEEGRKVSKPNHTITHDTAITTKYPRGGEVLGSTPSGKLS